jgi:hypothetical protein
MLGSNIHLRTFPLNFLRFRGSLFEKEWRSFWNSSQTSKFSSFIRKLKGLWTIVIGKSRQSVRLDLLFCRTRLLNHHDLSFTCSILINGKILQSLRPGNPVPWDLITSIHVNTEKKPQPGWNSKWFECRGRSQNCFFAQRSHYRRCQVSFFAQERSPHICEVNISVSPHSRKEKVHLRLKCLIPLEITLRTEIGNPRENSPPNTKFSSMYLFISSLFLEGENGLMFFGICQRCRCPFRSFAGDFDKT